MINQNLSDPTLLATCALNNEENYQCVKPDNDDGTGSEC